MHNCTGAASMIPFHHPFKAYTSVCFRLAQQSNITFFPLKKTRPPISSPKTSRPSSGRVVEAWTEPEGRFVISLLHEAGATCAATTRRPLPFPRRRTRPSCLSTAGRRREKEGHGVPFLPLAVARRVARTSGVPFLPLVCLTNQKPDGGRQNRTVDAVACAAAPYTSVRLTERDVSGTTASLSRWGGSFSFYFFGGSLWLQPRSFFLFCFRFFRKSRRQSTCEWRIFWCGQSPAQAQISWCGPSPTRPLCAGLGGSCKGPAFAWALSGQETTSSESIHTWKKSETYLEISEPSAVA